MKKIILASSSPRRRELLTKITKDFEIVTPTFDESKFSLSTNPISIENLSLSKAKSISIKLTISALVISADTVVIYGDRIMGKPKSREEAYDMIHDKEFIELVRCIGSVGVNIGVHLIMSTNMCVKSEFDKELFSLFGYVLTFDLSNSEQSRYINLKGAEFLKVCGEAMIKVRGKGVVRIQAPYISDKEIKNVVEFIKNENDAVNV